MRKITQEEVATLRRRRQGLNDFVAQGRNMLLDFASLLQLKSIEQIWDDPQAILPILEKFLQWEDLNALNNDERTWLHMRLTYFIGQLMAHRHSGIWKLEENPESQFFLRYVIGEFKDGTHPGLVVDPLSIVEAVFAQPSGRSLIALIDQAEAELKQTR